LNYFNITSASCSNNFHFLLERFHTNLLQLPAPIHYLTSYSSSCSYLSTKIVLSYLFSRVIFAGTSFRDEKLVKIDTMAIKAIAPFLDEESESGSVSPLPSNLFFAATLY
jgi:hypothetical protein